MPAEEWAVYKPVLKHAHDAHLRFALGGGLAFSFYSRMWRNTKDMDLFVLPRDREIAIGILNQLGFSDYFDQTQYDRSWIYRGFRDGVIVDIIWQMANHRAEVDERWLDGPRLDIDGMPLRAIPAEELIFAKLYVMQRERCDWPDLLNLLFARGAEVDWNHVRHRLGDDLPLLAGLLHVFAWLCPERAAQLPMAARALIGDAVANRGGKGQCDHDAKRVSLLDGRAWFVPLVKKQSGATESIH
jgi:hypothetical protein